MSHETVIVPQLQGESLQDAPGGPRSDFPAPEGSGSQPSPPDPPPCAAQEPRTGILERSPVEPPEAEDRLALERRRSADRMRATKHRRRKLRELWRGAVKVCPGKGCGCPWERAGLESCSCKPGWICSCEVRLRAVVEKDAAQRFGSLPGALITSAIVDTMRAEACGDEAAVRNARIHLIGLLLRDQRSRDDLEQRERRLRLQEGREAPSRAPLDSILAPLTTRATK